MIGFFLHFLFFALLLYVDLYDILLHTMSLVLVSFSYWGFSGACCLSVFFQFSLYPLGPSVSLGSVFAFNLSVPPFQFNILFPCLVMLCFLFNFGIYIVLLPLPFFEVASGVYLFFSYPLPNYLLCIARISPSVVVSKLLS